MSHDWPAIRKRFAEAHAKTGTTIRTFCEEEGIAYSSGRKHLNVSKVGEVAAERPYHRKTGQAEKSRPKVKASDLVELGAKSQPRKVAKVTTEEAPTAAAIVMPRIPTWRVFANREDFVFLSEQGYLVRDELDLFEKLGMEGVEFEIRLARVQLMRIMGIQGKAIEEADAIIEAATADYTGPKDKDSTERMNRAIQVKATAILGPQEELVKLMTLIARLEVVRQGDRDRYESSSTRARIAELLKERAEHGLTAVEVGRKMDAEGIPIPPVLMQEISTELSFAEPPAPEGGDDQQAFDYEALDAQYEAGLANADTAPAWVADRKQIVDELKREQAEEMKVGQRGTVAQAYAMENGGG